MRTDRLLIGIVIAGLLVTYTTIVYSFFQAEPETRFIYLTLLGLPLAAVFFMTPRSALFVLGILVYSVDWLSEFWTLIPREATWIIDLILVLFVVRTIITIPYRSLKTSTIEIFIWIALGFAIISAMANGQGTATTLVGIRVGFKYMLLFIAAYHLNVTPQWFRKFIGVLFFIGLVQTPVILAQWALLGWDSPDILCGTFGRSQTPGVALFLLMLFVYLASRMIEQRRMPIGYLLLILWMTIAPLIGEAKFYFMFLPILILFLVRAEFRRRPGMAVGILLTGVILIFAVDYVIVETGFWKEGRNPLTYIGKLPEVFESELEGPRGDRIERTYKFVYAIKLAAASPKDFFLGNGPGSITHSYVMTSRSAVKDYYSRWGLSSSGATIPWLLIEYGYIGTLLFLFILYLIYRRGRLLRQSDDEQMRIYGRMLEGATFLYGAWMFYAAAWQADTMSFVFWPVAAILVRFSYIEEEKRKMALTMERIEESKTPIKTAVAFPA